MPCARGASTWAAPPWTSREPKSIPTAKLELHASRPARRRVRTRLSVLHEDGDVIIVDKPAGLLTVPTEAREKDTLWSRVLFYLQHRYGGRPYAGIVHRLDKDTSGRGGLRAEPDGPALSPGALPRARHRAGVRRPSSPAHPRTRAPTTPTWSASRASAAAWRARASRGGSAVTHYRTLERLPGASLVAARLETGRTHQIRVHFSAAGHPVLGDRVYGPRDAEHEAPRQMLHASTLGFPHPVDGAARRRRVTAADGSSRQRWTRSEGSHKSKRPGAVERRAVEDPRTREKGAC